MNEWEMGRMCQAEAVELINGLAGVNGDSWRAYLVYMGVRLEEMRRILKPTGSGYYHCDSVMSHGIKLLMDAIFGRRNFRNEIVWSYRKMPNKARFFQRNNDIILFYTKTDKYGLEQAI